MICPRCHLDAPPVVRGVRAYCTACGAPRSLLDAPEAVNVAGQPHKVGAGIASVLGWVGLAVGLCLALFVGGIGYLAFSVATSLWVGGPIALLTLLITIPLLLGGRRLNQKGDARARAAQEHAIFTLAAQRRGVLTAREVARALEIPDAEADALLTALAKRPEGGVALEVDDNGAITYQFTDLLAAPRVRVAPQQGPAPQQVIDAELIDAEEEAAAAAERRATR
jgi:hypothetical protein